MSDSRTLDLRFNIPDDPEITMVAALETRANTPEAVALDTSLEPYNRLLRMLVPTLRGVVVHDGFGNLIWSSEEWELPDDLQLVNDAIDNALRDGGEFAGIQRTVDADHAAYSFAVRDHEGRELLGVVSLLSRLVGSQTEARPLRYIRQLVQPALECLRRELSLRIQLGSREQDVGVRERNLPLMLQMSLQRTAIASDVDEFQLILRTGLEHLNCTLAALWVPDKDIEISLTQSGQPMSPELLKRAQQHLMSWMQVQQRTILINKISKVASEAAAPYKILASPIRHPSGRVMGILAVFNPPSAPDFDGHQQRIAELLAKKAAPVIQAQYDPSTGLMTRQALERQAAVLLGAPAADLHCVLYLDIDRLHVINEIFGMHVGDDVIVSVAQAMAAALPRGASASRIAGDRFAALVPNCGIEAAAKAADIVCSAVATIVPRAGQGAFEVSASIGVAPIGSSDNALAHALATAEIACKAAKDRGRNRAEIFRDSDDSIIRRHTDLLVIGKLKGALESNRFRLDAQPILPLRADLGRPRFELLIRMLGENGEIIPPGKFLSAAERYQLMPVVDRWVIEHACAMLGRHSAALRGESVQSGDGACTRFAINLSGQSLQDDSFLELIQEQIHSTGLTGHMLCFELTEGATIGNLSKAQHFIRTLQELGCHFALDDFGTGVSSLAYLKDLAVNHLKIDGTFVRDALVNARSDSMIRAIAQLAKTMGMTTIAEHVETDDLRVRMTDLGVDYAQGLAMGKSQPLSSLLDQLLMYAATVSSCPP